MFLRRFLSRLFRDPAALRSTHCRCKARTKQRRPLRLDLLEDRVVPSLIGLAALGVAPDIASDAHTDLSYTQGGNNANPFHYEAVPLTLTLGDGSQHAISNSSGGGSAATTLDLTLDNTGHFTTAGPATAFTITGQVTIGANTFDGTLLTGAVRDFGFSTPTPTDTEFEVKIDVTGGQLVQQPNGLYRVGSDVGLLIHQPGLPIHSFPQTFAITASTTGSSDTREVKAIMTNSEPGGPCG
jgi:hypothetical protein